MDHLANDGLMGGTMSRRGQLLPADGTRIPDVIMGRTDVKGEVLLAYKHFTTVGTFYGFGAIAIFLLFPDPFVTALFFIGAPSDGIVGDRTANKISTHVNLVTSV